VVLKEEEEVEDVDVHPEEEEVEDVDAPADVDADVK